MLLKSQNSNVAMAMSLLLTCFIVLGLRGELLDLKALLLEGYDTEGLLGVIPFVCKVLEPCGKSKVFKPPNPWVMALMSLLAEL